ncbi:mercury(II) reductase [Longimicrobium sp.]|uniref:mercury(II) reductase n=1 Tax=Longimicrobium sp. TaxID=2029185 RepID=UPI002E346FA5|nr:mercury(II) reductase [Longimicrobium sp.]HEX6037755.1 mercury(II) reductase [Longimicrobium sp.]
MKLDLQFRGMTCLSCAQHVQEALQAVPGVRSALASYPTQRGTVTMDEGVDPHALISAVAAVGYGAEILRETGEREHSTGATPSPDVGEGDAYELLIIGTGGAGTSAAIRASELGVAAAVVERGEVVGGTCVNVGCIPSKYLIEAAAHYHAARTAFPGIRPCEPGLAWAEVVRRKREIVEGLRQDKYLDVLASYEGITLLHGRAELLGGGRVRVGDAEVKARLVIVATGTRPVMPPIPGLSETGALDSTTAMDLEALPESMIVIGAGSIGLELGQAFSRFGVRVAVLDVAERILPQEHPEVSAELARVLEAEGMEIHTGIRVTGVSRGASGYKVHVQDGSVSGSVEAEQLLVATGRAPNTGELGLEAAGVETDPAGFIRVDEHMRTSNPTIFAAGDVTGGPGYVYVAALGGGIAAQAALSEATGEAPIPIDLSAVPRVTFTDPQVAAVGLTEEEAEAAGYRARATTFPIAALPRGVVSHRAGGLVKLVAEEGTDRLLGAHLVAPNAGDVIGEAVLAVRFGLTTRDLISTLHAYLTWGEGLKLSAQTFTRDVAKLSCCA